MESIHRRSLVEELQAPPAPRKRADPWRNKLARIEGDIALHDGAERIKSRDVFEFLGLPNDALVRHRAAPRVRRVMESLGWEPVAITRGKWRGNARGYIKRVYHSNMVRVKSG